MYMLIYIHIRWFVDITNTPAPHHFRQLKSRLRRALPKTQKSPMKHAKEPLKTRKRAL